jgi:hypothetical protein
MPDATIRIDRREREALHRLLHDRFGDSLVDAGLMIKRGDFVAAERFGNEFAADVRMLNDLGWDPGDRRETFALTMMSDELAATLWRLRVEAEGGVDEPEEVRRGRTEDDELLVKYTHARDVCAELIARLDPQPAT